MLCQIYASFQLLACCLGFVIVSTLSMRFIHMF